MGAKMTGLWVAAVAAAGAIGWFSALQVERGPAFKDEQDTYERFANAMTINDSMDRTETMVKLVRRLTPETLPGAIKAFKDDLQDIYNNDLRMLIRRGLGTSKGSYRGLLQLFGLDESDYKRLLNFLAAHECSIDFREFRTLKTDRDAASGAA